jgi:hypothetical protein
MSLKRVNLNFSTAVKNNENTTTIATIIICPSSNPKLK